MQKVQNSSDLCLSQFWILAAFSIFADLPTDSHLLENVYFSREKYEMKYTYQQIASHVSCLGCLFPILTLPKLLCAFCSKSQLSVNLVHRFSFLAQSTSLAISFKRLCKNCFHSDFLLFVKSWFVSGWLNLKWSFSTPLGCREKLNPFGKDSKPRFPKIFVNKFTEYF